jgi:hypothetical protein
VTDGGTVTGKATMNGGICLQTVGADGHKHLAGQPVKGVIQMTKGRRSPHGIANNLRFGLDAPGKSINIKPKPELQVL